MKNFSKVLTLGFITLSLAGIVWLLVSMFSSESKLPVLGEPGHVAGSFSFINQHGKKITENEVRDKVVLVEYFFTTCPGICKNMNKNLSTVYRAYKNNNQFTILSHTVDPENDSVKTLADYASLINANEPGWEFLTGDKTALYNAAKKEYLLAVDENKANIEDEFIHTEYVALLDRQRRIRGFYDATDSLKMQTLIKDIGRLLKE